MTVSVIIPAYRAAAVIGRALKSVAAQTVPPGRVIVVDDGSADGTAEAAKSLSNLFDDGVLKVIEQCRRGPGAARNRGLAEAASTYVAFLDADDEWLAEHLERSLAEMAKGNFVLTAHDFLAVRGETREHIACARRFRAAADPYSGLYRQGFIGASTVVARLDAIEAAGRFDETLAAAQDFDLWLALAAAPGARFTVFDAPLALYYPSPDGITGKTWQRLRCTLRVAGRNAGALKGRPGGILGNLWNRVLAVHYEAARAFFAKGDFIGLLGVLAVLPVNLVLQTTGVLFSRRL